MGKTTEKSPLEKIIYQPHDFIINLKKFWKTKNAVRTGVPLYEWSSSQRKEKGFLGPWSLNIQETLYASLPSGFIVKVLDFLYGRPQILSHETEQLDKRTQIFNEILKSTNQFFHSFYVPIFFTLIVLIVGWCSLKRKDSTKESRARSRKAYLYFDGAYGLFSQFILTLYISLEIWFKLRPELLLQIPHAMEIAWYSLVAIAFVIQFYLSMMKIPDLLFQVNGYNSNRSNKEGQKEDPPFTKWWLGNCISGYPLIIFLNFILSKLAISAAWILTEIKIFLIG